MKFRYTIYEDFEVIKADSKEELYWMINNEEKLFQSNKAMAENNIQIVDGKLT